jgi:N-acetylmuramoyl-L-alanine amidase
MWLIPGLLAAAAPLMRPASPLQVTSVRFWSEEAGTRVVIETTGTFVYRTERLTEPDRVFFDIPARPRMVTRGMHRIAVGDKLLKQIRIAETAPGLTRVVLDLEPGTQHTASLLSKPDRLVVELRGPKSTAKPAIEKPPVSRAEPPKVEPPKSAPPKVESPRKVEEPPKKVEAAKSEPARKDHPAREPVTKEPAKKELAKKDPPRRLEPVEVARLDPPSAELAEPVPVRTESKPSFSRTIEPRPEVKPEVPAAPPAKPARRVTGGGMTMTRALGLKTGRIVIDPGHGGHDPGTSGPGGLLEKDLVLDVALRVGALIEDRLGAEVVYTRSDDTFIPLEGRVELANENKADLFLSIHANSSQYPSVTGVETYYLNLTTNREALDLASRENASSRRNLHDLTDLIQKIARNDKIVESREFAQKMQASLFTVAKQNPNAKNRGVKRAPLVVLLGAMMPSVLAEIGFVSNPRDEAQLKKPEQRQKIAEALYRGLARYAETLSHFQVARAKD